MERDDGAFGADWVQLSEQVLSGMRDWRVQHPRATLTEIEEELDSRLAGIRARLLEHLAQQSQAAAWGGRRAAAGEPAREPPRCPQCRTPLEARGRKTRRLKTHGGRELAVRREYGVCPQCGQGLFPPG
jgi:YgiT-type zinc finger domain-containing protein